MLKVGGRLHRTEQIHGATVSRKKLTKTNNTVIATTSSGHAQLANLTTEEDRSCYLGTTITDRAVETWDSTC